MRHYAKGPRGRPVRGRGYHNDVPGSIETTLRTALQASLEPSGDGLVCVYLFGSQAEGRTHRESDVDIAVLLDRAAFPTRESRFEAGLQTLGRVSGILGRNDVDVLVLNDAPPTLAARVVTQGRPLYCSDPTAELRFRRDAMLRAADLAPFLRRMERLTLEALRR